jgi:diketogulonate reductase-like aldo/keto reductase
MESRRRALLALLAAGALRPSLAQDGIMTKRIASSAEALPVIGVGTWQTFDVGSDPAARAPLREVLRLLNGNVIDSSPMYGSSEAVAGELMAELGMRERVFVATKVWAQGHDAGIAQMEASFRLLRVERMDLMQVHNLADVATHTKTLLDWKAKKRIRYIGITHYTASAYAEVERAMKTRQYDFLQINYSLGEREAERRILQIAHELRMAVIANRPFAEGALFRRVKGRPLPPWAAELGIESWAQYFLKWIVAHPAVTCAIPGTGNPKHMKDNLGAGHGPLPDQGARKRMAEYFDAQG